MSRPFAITLEPKTSLKNHTGSWRSQIPCYVSKIPPCNVTCPAGENIQAWLKCCQEGDFRGAWNEITKNNPFPAIMGRICYHTCQAVCNRGQFDSSVSINLIEKYIGDLAIKGKWQFSKPNVNTGKKVLILGAGPAGLSAAYFLRQIGHDVTIYEANEKLGGMMRYGVPKYRLSRDVLDAEISRILDMGINLRANFPLSDLEEVLDKFDAVFISTGAHKASKTDIKTTGKTQIYDAIDLLKIIESERSIPNFGNSVLVYGGGNTAIDTARSIIRLGVKDVKIVYRRDLVSMPAHKEEVLEALAEGIEIIQLRTIKEICGNKITMEVMEMCDDSLPRPLGEFENVTADSIIMAIGQSIDDGMLKNIPEIKIGPKGVIEIGANMMTGRDGVFAGGDVAPSKRNVTVAIGHGKKASKAIDAYLNSCEYVHHRKPPVANYKSINTSYFEKSDNFEKPSHVNLSFQEEAFSLSDEQAIFQSSRCFSCGNCFECDNCYGMCPDAAIKKLGKGLGFEINREYCKGCGICAVECPCGAINMTEEKDK